MRKDEIINAAELYVRDYMADKEAGHNWWHIERVRRNALFIQKSEGAGDPFVIELAALLHDIGDDKIDRNSDGIKLVRSFPSERDTETRVIDAVCGIMSGISFRDTFNSDSYRTVELDVVQDADRLDALGAIGIARAFAYGGTRGNEIYNPGQEVRQYRSKEEYAGSDSSSINHFYEKLFKLKAMMNTPTGLKLAEERHRYMEEYLERFFREWNLDQAESDLK